ncbi:hypothetical protein [Paractinoplanes atraurantiacus]|uniref:Uncharacterized protein n=1 Tax=Paractinoplanes atraurantiacus TaxID=1036182 RepID=A0A285KJS6_9ACTN|nr:hypothetical protein [Actinoplanes atraurantiacus]SNY72860.1 hypothetical protein SAMN05421748_14434 [Actinoplanes atraurantiacus]
MSLQIEPVPYRQSDPSPGPAERRTRRRIVIFVVVVILGGVLVGTGRDLEAVVLTLLGVGLAGATIARWVIDDVALPGVGSLDWGQRA